MSNTKRFIYAFLVTSAFMTTTAAAERKEAGGRVQVAIQDALKGTTITSVYETPWPGVYEVIAGKNVLYADPGGKYLMVGSMWDIASQQDLTKERIDEMRGTANSRVLPWTDLRAEDAISHGDPDGYRVAIFTDPDCPYCRKMRAYLDSLEGVHVYEYLMPLAQLHPAAVGKSRQIWCSENRLASLQIVMSGGQLDNSATCDSEAIDRNAAFAANVGISGTPTMIRADGKVHSGFLNRLAFERWVMSSEIK